MRRSFRLSILILLGLAACQTPSLEESAPLPYHVPDTVRVAQLFAEGVISSALPEFATTFSPDGYTVYFNRTPPDRSALRIWSAPFAEGRWREAAPLPFSDGTYRDIDPFMSPDGQRLYFSSTRPLEGSASKDFDLWYVERTANGWSAPINLGAPVNTAQDEIYATVSRNGNLYFSVFEAEGNGVAIYRSVWVNGAFLAPERQVIGADTLRLTNPAIAPDEGYLILVFGAGGPSDLYLSRRLAGGEWGEAVPLGSAVNSPFSEFAPAVSHDGTTLFFTSERPGVVPEGAVDGRPPGDLYVLPIRAALP